MTNDGADRITAAELLAQLAGDPHRVNEETERAERLAAEEAELFVQQEPILRDLAELELLVETVWNIGRTAAARPRVAEVLVRHLEFPNYADSIKAALALSLATPRAAWAWERILRLYRSERNSFVKERLADTLARSAPEDALEQLENEVRDEQNGESRLLLLLGYVTIGTDESRRCLESLAAEPYFEESARDLLHRKWSKRRSATT